MFPPLIMLMRKAKCDIHVKVDNEGLHVSESQVFSFCPEQHHQKPRVSLHSSVTALHLYLTPAWWFQAEKAAPDGRSEWVIPKGDIVFTSPAVAGRLESVWTSPNAFDPDRFIKIEDGGREEDKGSFKHLGPTRAHTQTHRFVYCFLRKRRKSARHLWGPCQVLVLVLWLYFLGGILQFILNASYGRGLPTPLGFGGGMHGCLGQQFGYLQVKAIMATVLRLYDIEPIGPLPKPDYEAMVVGPKGTPLVRFKRRV